MAIFWTIVAIILAASLTVTIFIYGPDLIMAAAEKIDEWQEIIDAFKEEK